MYLIDTDIFVYSMQDHPMVSRHFREKARTNKALSVITYGELLAGALRSERRQEKQAKARGITEFFPVIEVSRGIMETFASIKADLGREGKPLEEFDLIIAATALVLGFKLVTNNEKHFRRIQGLTLENWTKQSGSPK